MYKIEMTKIMPVFRARVRITRVKLARASALAIKILLPPYNIYSYIRSDAHVQHTRIRTRARECTKSAWTSRSKFRASFLYAPNRCNQNGETKKPVDARRQVRRRRDNWGSTSASILRRSPLLRQRHFEDLQKWSVVGYHVADRLAPHWLCRSLSLPPPLCVCVFPGLLKFWDMRYIAGACRRGLNTCVYTRACTRERQASAVDRQYKLYTV